LPWRGRQSALQLCAKSLGSSSSGACAAASVKRWLSWTITRFAMPVSRKPSMAFGPLKDSSLTSRALIPYRLIACASPASSNRAAVEALVARDPFAVAGLIESLTILEWAPLFGAFATESSRHLPELEGEPDSNALLRGA
jgi:hypothetical protein